MMQLRKQSVSLKIISRDFLNSNKNRKRIKIKQSNFKMYNIWVFVIPEGKLTDRSKLSSANFASCLIFSK